MIQAYTKQIFTAAFPLLSDEQYVYGRLQDFNIEGDNRPSPAVHIIEPDQEFLNVSSSGYANDGYNLFIRFVQLIPEIGIAEQAITREEAIYNQKVAAAAYISALNDSDIFKEIPNPIRAVRVIEAYDGNWFGVEVNLTNLVTLQPLPVC